MGAPMPMLTGRGYQPYCSVAMWLSDGSILHEFLLLFDWHRFAPNLVCGNGNMSEIFVQALLRLRAIDADSPTLRWKHNLQDM
eukprot:2197512-Amphidinium_carterae.1